MTTPPLRTRVRRTEGSRKVGDFLDRHGLRPVSVYLPIELHRALAGTAIEAGTNLQGLFTLACSKFYGGEVDLPPLVAPTRTKSEPHKSVTWYADVDLHKRMKMLAVDLDGSVQQLIVSAIVAHLKRAPRVKALNIQSGFPAYAQAPEELTPPSRH